MRPAWFVATLIFKCEIEGKPTSPGEWTCTQDVFVISAYDRDEAYEKALGFTESQETSYLNSEGEVVTWKFVGLENLEMLSEKAIRDGIEIWSRMFHTENPDALVVEKEGLSVYFDDEIAGLPADEIIQGGIETKLVCNRVKIYPPTSSV